MRALVLGLILANILYWTWASNIDAPVSALAPALDSDLPKLELVPRPVIEVAETVYKPSAESDTGAEGVLASELQRDGEAVGGLNTEAADGALDDDGVSNVADIASPDANATDTAKVESASTDNELAQVSASLFDSNLIAAVDPVANPARCAGVGPFTSLKQASEAAARINEAGLTTSQRVEESQVWVGHWVHLPSYPSRAAAVEVVEKLREQGITDIYIEPSGELRNTISLGLFSERAGAETRAGLVRKLGDVKPQIRNRSRDGLVYWVDVSLEAGVSLDISTLPHNPAQELVLKSVDCPPLSASG